MSYSLLSHELKVQFPNQYESIVLTEIAYRGKAETQGRLEVYQAMAQKWGRHI